MQMPIPHMRYTFRRRNRRSPVFCRQEQAEEGIAQVNHQGESLFFQFLEQPEIFLPSRPLMINDQPGNPWIMPEDFFGARPGDYRNLCLRETCGQTIQYRQGQDYIADVA